MIKDNVQVNYNKEEFSSDELDQVNGNLDKIVKLTHANLIQFDIVREKHPQALPTHREIDICRVEKLNRTLYHIKDFYKTENHTIPLSSSSYSHRYLLEAMVENGRFV